jgi:hypothetical protein
MNAIRGLLRKSFIAPVALSLLALRVLDNIVSALSADLSTWLIPAINNFARSRIRPYVEIDAPPSLGWRYEVVIWGIFLAALLLAWLLALWLYPESTTDESLPLK